MLNFEKSTRENGFNKLFIVEVVLFFHFKLFEKLIQLVIWKLLPQISHHISKFFDGDSRALGFENGLHCLNKLILCLWLLIFTS
jgi:hypothetical protein